MSFSLITVYRITQWVRERGFLSLPVVAIGSIPYIIPACGFPAPGDPRCLAHIREHGFTPCLAAFQRRKRCCERGLSICSGILHSDGVFSKDEVCLK